MKIKNTWRLLLLAAFITKLQEILTAITANAAFASLATKVTALQDKLTELSDTNADYAATKAALDTLRQKRDDLRGECQELTGALASAVEGVAGSDVALILSTGFEVRAGRGSSSLVAAPANLRAVLGKLEGTVDLRWVAVPQARNYVVEMATDADGPWTQLAIQPQVTFTVEGLTSGTKYYFRVRAVGYLGAGPFSDIAEKRAP